jgi:hypothetical protein
MKGKPIDLCDQELAWIEAHHDWSRQDLHRGFCARYMRTDVSLSNLASLCKRKGWLTGRTGCFAPGQAPANKGKPMPYNAASAATRFKKGQRPANKVDIGHESINRGYVMVCVAAPNPHTSAQTHMAFKHRWLWEQAHGPVPDGMALKCLDGDRTNCSPANWQCIPVAMLPRLNGRFGRGYDTAPAEVKPVIMLISTLEHKARTARKGAA